MPANLPATVLILLACGVTTMAGTKCKYGAKVSRLQVRDGAVSWSVSKRPATCVDHLSVCWGVVGQPPSCTTVPRSARNLTLEGLQPCRWHNVSVVAVADRGLPAHAASLLHFVVGAALPPQASLDAKPAVRLAQPSRVAISVDETGSSPAERCFSHYTACWSTADGEETCKRKRSYDAVLETGRLQLCSNYSFTFWTSLLDLLNSSATSLVQFTGVGDVRDVRITSVSSSDIGVRWQGPAAGEGDCVDHYRMLHDAGSAEVPAGAAAEYLVRGLLPCKHYFVDVLAVSPHGTTSNPVRRRAITRPAVPGMVRDLHVQWTTSRRVLVQWKAPEDTRFCHVRYSLCWRKSGVDNERCARHKLSPYPSHAIGKLKPCTEYAIKVAVLGAEKVLGDAAAIRAMTGPEPVANLREERTPSGERVLQWDAPACAHSYLVCWGTWGGGGSYVCANTTDASFIAPRLDHAITYSVVAVAAGGASSDRALLHHSF